LIVRKALSLIAAIAAMAAAAAVCVVAAAYALYAFLRYYLDPAWASAAIAIGFAVIAVVLAWLAFRKTRPESFRRARDEDPSLAAKLIELAREKPLIAAAAAAAAGFVVLRNPRVLATAITAAMAGRARDAERDRRRSRR
jgi:ABC-type nickel/cobalt efflux system permease component RcnA